MSKIALLAGVALAVLSTSAFAADLSMPAAAPVLPAGVSWDGPYIGAHVGYGPGTLTQVGAGSFLFEEASEGQTDGTHDFDGFFGGLQAGYNFSTGNVVFGVQGDFSWANETGSATFFAGDEGSFSNKLDWTGAVTGHVGYNMGSFMPYALAGLAFAHNTETISGLYGSGEDNSTSASATHTGYTIGAGVEAMFTSNVSGFLEARYSDYGTRSYDFSTDEEREFGTLAASMTDASVRAGLNYHF